MDSIESSSSWRTEPSSEIGCTTQNRTQISVHESTATESVPGHFAGRAQLFAVQQPARNEKRITLCMQHEQQAHLAAVQVGCVFVLEQRKQVVEFDVGPCCSGRGQGTCAPWRAAKRSGNRSDRNCEQSAENGFVLNSCKHGIIAPGGTTTVFLDGAAAPALLRALTLCSKEVNSMQRENRTHLLIAPLNTVN